VLLNLAEKQSYQSEEHEKNSFVESRRLVAADYLKNEEIANESQETCNNDTENVSSGQLFGYPLQEYLQ
jgi:hypothetical protein